jgi:hypothetical protein
MASSVAKLKQSSRRKTRHGETANGRVGETANRRIGARDSHQLQRNNGRASMRSREALRSRSRRRPRPRIRPRGVMECWSTAPIWNGTPHERVGGAFRAICVVTQPRDKGRLHRSPGLIYFATSWHSPYRPPHSAHSTEISVAATFLYQARTALITLPSK